MIFDILVMHFVLAHFVLAFVDSFHSNCLFLKWANRKCCEDVWIYLCVEGGVELGTEFRSEIIPRNRPRTVFVILLKKVLIPRHSDFRGRTNSEAGNGMEFREKISFTKQPK
jgi:hypothetical protein